MNQSAGGVVAPKSRPAVRLRLPLSGLARQEERWAYLMLLPSILGLVFFTAGPVVESLAISFTRYNVVRPPQWIGPANYIQLFTKDRVFVKAFKNTCLYVFGTTPSSITLSLLLALALNQKIRGIPFFRSIFFLPTISSGVAVALLWTWLYNPDFGIFNWILGLLGVSREMRPAWLASTTWALPALMIMAVWQGLGYNMTIFLAGLQGIDPSYYEAAEIDGAGWWARFRYITLPLISPTTFFLLVMAGIGGFQVFVPAFVMTAGGPRYATTTVALHLFYTAFQYMRMGEASAMAYVMFAVVFTLTFLQLRLQKLWVHYE